MYKESDSMNSFGIKSCLNWNHSTSKPSFQNLLAQDFIMEEYVSEYNRSNSHSHCKLWNYPRYTAICIIHISSFMLTSVLTQELHNKSKSKRCHSTLRVCTQLPNRRATLDDN